MLILTALSIYFLALSDAQKTSLKSCSDCVLLSSCPGALYLVVNKKDAETQELLKNALCSADYIDGLPQVCCSGFPPSPTSIDQHRNKHLLPEKCGEIDGNRIVGGTVAKLYEFPWMVLISYETRIGPEFRCGGSLINNLYVLTAAHCVKKKKILGVRIGDHNWKTKTDCQGEKPKICESNIQDIGVAENIIYPEYSEPPNILNDIALLRLARPVDLNVPNARPICLPIQSQLISRNLDSTSATVAGWGFTEQRKASEVLLKVILPIWSRERCSSFYSKGKTQSNPNILCAGEEGKDSCKGDSGGPLMVTDKINGKDKFVQYGIVSYGPIQCGSMTPGVYTAVTKYIEWILDNIRE